MVQEIFENKNKSRNKWKYIFYTDKVFRRSNFLRIHPDEIFADALNSIVAKRNIEEIKKRKVKIIYQKWDYSKANIISNDGEHSELEREQ